MFHLNKEFLNFNHINHEQARIPANRYPAIISSVVIVNKTLTTKTATRLTSFFLTNSFISFLYLFGFHKPLLGYDNLITISLWLHLFFEAALGDSFLSLTQLCLMIRITFCRIINLFLFGDKLRDEFGEKEKNSEEGVL